MDRAYIVHFENGDSTDITPAELEGLGKNLDAPNTQNFQWLKRTEGWLVIAMDKVTSIEPKKMTGDAVVTPTKPDTIRREKEEAQQRGISSAEAVLERLKNEES